MSAKQNSYFDGSQLEQGTTDVAYASNPNISSVLSPKKSGHLASSSLQKAKRKLKPNVSRDEMNLAEFPLAVLSTRVDNKVKTLEFTDYSRGPKGEMIERRWIITGADKFGLPTATDDDVVLGLIRLSMDQDFREPKVYFTRYELLKTLRWSTEGRSYQRLVKSLDRLSGVRIRSSNSFYDNASKSYQTSNFGIIDAYEINDERAGKGIVGEKNSFFIWSEMLFDSFKSGYIKKLDLDLYFSLKSAVARRLYRYLDKHFYFKNTLEAHLYTLAFEKIGLSRSYKYVSSIKQQLKPALNELIEIGFLETFSYLGQGQDSIIKFIARTNSPAKSTSIDITNESQSEKVAEKESTLSNDVTSSKGILNDSLQTNLLAEGSKSEIIKQAESLKKQITPLLLERGISERQSGRLLYAHGVEALKKILKIITFYDELCANSDQRVSKNPVGFLYRAVESPYKIKIPVARQSGLFVEKNGGKSIRPEHKVFKAERKPTKKTQGKPNKIDEVIPPDDPRREEYRNYIQEELDSIMARVDPKELGELYAETENKMKSLKRILGNNRFQEAVDACVRDELKRKFNLPTFELWIKENRSKKKNTTH